MGRAPCCDKANVKRGPWSSEEDTKLRSHINKHGIGSNWIALPHKIGLKRCGKSCRLRWLNYLRPNIKHGGFTEDEDNLICTLYITIGSRWSIMAAHLPGRTDNDIKNYWNTRLKKKLLGQQQSCKNSRTTDHNYSLNSDISFSHHPQLVPPLPVENWSLDRFTNIIPIMPQIEALNFGYDLTQPDHFNSDVSCVQLYEQQICKDQGLENDIQINLPPLDGMYVSLPQPLDGVNGSSNSSSSLDNISWGDANCIVYPQSAMTNYEVCHQEIPQYCTFFDEPRLPGFS